MKKISVFAFNLGFILFTSCGQNQSQSVQNPQSKNYFTLNSPLHVLNSTPSFNRISKFVNIPTLKEQQALNEFNENQEVKLVEGFNEIQPPNPTPAQTISFNEFGFLSPYLICYFDVPNEKTQTSQVVWKWGLDVYTEKNSHNIPVKKRKGLIFLGTENRFPNLALFLQKETSSIYKESQIQQICDNTRLYWSQKKSDLNIVDQVENPLYKPLPSNASLVYYEEAKSSLGAGRSLYTKDNSPRTKFTSLVAFGDSITDNGNMYRKTAHLLPRTDYYFHGRFTNGFNWMDDVQYTLNIPVYNSAYASAETSNVVNFGVPLSVLKAIDDYQVKKGIWNGAYFGGYIGSDAAYGGGGDPATTLFSIYAGGNNYLDFLADSHYPGGIKFNKPNSPKEYLNVEEYTTQSVLDLELAAKKIINMGGKTILLGNLPDLGFVPKGRNSGFADELTKATEVHNRKLHEMVQHLAQENKNVSFIYMNVNAMLKEVLAHPEIYHFIEEVKPCYSGKYWDLPTDPKPQVCGDESVQAQYVFWDGVHPTKRAHGFIGYLLNNYLYKHFKKTL